MRQYVLAQKISGNGEIQISGKDSKYILRVLRLKVGDSFPAIGKDGKRFSLKISGTSTDSFTATYTEKENTDKTENMIDLTLVQCLPKGKKLENIVRQAVESGVSLIIPVESDNAIPVLRDDRSSKKLARLKKIAEEAAQQSGNPGVPKIYETVKITQIPKLLEKLKKNELKLFFHQDKLANTSLHRCLENVKKSVSILIGPEGGLSPKETAFLLDSDFNPVYLGRNVLRTETAAVFALGAVKTILLEKSEWKAVTHV